MPKSLLQQDDVTSFVKVKQAQPYQCRHSPSSGFPFQRSIPAMLHSGYSCLIPFVAVNMTIHLFSQPASQCHNHAPHYCKQACEEAPQHDQGNFAFSILQKSPLACGRLLDSSPATVKQPGSAAQTDNNVACLHLAHDAVDKVEISSVHLATPVSISAFGQS
ncbi:TPA: hypothetical protein ACH3X2_012297 [Trebouxia sp. C0005]